MLYTYSVNISIYLQAKKKVNVFLLKGLSKNVNHFFNNCLKLKGIVTAIFTFILFKFFTIFK